MHRQPYTRRGPAHRQHPVFRYTHEAHALGVQVKFYYTIRELTNHVAELYALKALQGEVLTSGDPWVTQRAGWPGRSRSARGRCVAGRCKLW